MFVVFLAGVLGIRKGESGPEVLSTVGLYLSLAIIISRIAVEYSHHHKYQIWLHRQYHKLTDHDAPDG